MRYIVNENNYVTAVIFGAEVLYNDCTCTEYTGGVPSGWETLDDWYFDEGDKLWRWQIVDGDLMLDESAVAPEEHSWTGIVIDGPVFVTTPSGSDSTAIVFDLPGGTKNLRCFFVLINEWTNAEYDQNAYCVAIRTSVDEDVTDVVYSFRGSSIDKVSASGCFTLDENTVKVNLNNADSRNGESGVFRKSTEYALYPFYHR